MASALGVVVAAREERGIAAADRLAESAFAEIVVEAQSVIVQERAKERLLRT